MKKLNPLPHTLLCRFLNPKDLNFETTAELETLTDFLGQERAVESVRFGIGIKSQGYNLFAMGPSGIGKLSLIRTILEATAKKQSIPPDWCYIHNFKNPEKPLALQLPAGVGFRLQQDMKLLIEELETNILGVFESDEYRTRLAEINNIFNIKKERVSKKYIENGENTKISHLYKERYAKEKALQNRFTLEVLAPMIRHIKKRNIKYPHVINYLSAVQRDILHYVGDFIKQEEKTKMLSFVADNAQLTKYQVNLLVNNSKRKGAPIVYEVNPSYSNLICRVEHTHEYGNLLTNFTLIRAGALHRANGGYLIIEARKLKKQLHAWEGLKRALYSRKIRIEQVEHLSESVRPISLEPMAIPLNVKIILLGDRNTYYYLYHHDPDYRELFKVAVDFDEQIVRNKYNIKLYSRLIATIARRENLLRFHNTAVAKIIDYSSRLAEDIEKLSTHIRSIDDLILEANYWASAKNKKMVRGVDVKQAIGAQIHRVDRMRELYYEEINRNIVIINSEGKMVGQVNALSVVRVGNFSFGHPTCVTVKVRPGKGKIMDIQRAVKLAGPIHHKAILILENFIANRFNQNHPFSLHASIAFEQIYGTIEGDSASVAEVCALLSAIAEVPVNQGFAVTGSINQHGAVQAIGGVNEKIEGFFDICKERKLTGRQGVIIPAINKTNLMLREDVVLAAKNREFYIYPIESIDEAIELLMGIPAGSRRKKGNFPVDSLNYKVEARLALFNKSYHRTQKT